MHKQPDEITLALIARYMNNELSVSEKEQFELWVNASEENRKELETTLKIWEMASLEPTGAFDTDSAWTKMSLRIRGAKKQHPASAGKYFIPVFRIAASLLLLAGLAFVIRWFVIDHQYREIAATYEKILNPVILPDGSKVFLNVGSKIKFPKKFGNIRTVELTGEAFFKVVHNDESLFVVQTGSAKVKVLGTSFNVLASRDSVQVVVESGIVELSSRLTNKNMQLARGNSGVFLTRSGKMVKSATSDINAFAWRTNELIFNNADLNYVVTTLSRVYSQTIKFDNDQLKSFKLNAEYENLDLEGIFKALKTTHCLEVKKVGDSYLITGPGC